MKKFLTKVYDKLILSLLFSALFISSCDEPEPIPEYGVVPLYGVPSQIIQPNATNSEITELKS